MVGFCQMWKLQTMILGVDRMWRDYQHWWSPFVFDHQMVHAIVQLFSFVWRMSAYKFTRFLKLNPTASRVKCIYAACHMIYSQSTSHLRVDLFLSMKSWLLRHWVAEIYSGWRSLTFPLNRHKCIGIFALNNVVLLMLVLCFQAHFDIQWTLGDTSIWLFKFDTCRQIWIWKQLF